MPFQLRNNEAVGLLSADFQKRTEPNFAWQNVLSMYCMLPGIRGFWPTSSFGQVGANDYDLIDLSGQGRHLTGAAAPLYGHDGLAPYVEIDGTKDWFHRATESGFDILGNEAYVVEPGITAGCWFYPTDIAGYQELLSKWGAAGQRSYSFAYAANFGGDPFQFTMSDDGTNTDFVRNPNTTLNTWNFGVGRFNDADAGEELAAWVNTIKTTAATARPSIFASNASFMIGSSTGGTGLFTGRISLAFLCASALPDYMINALYGHTKAMFAHV